MILFLFDALEPTIYRARVIIFNISGCAPLTRGNAVTSKTRGQYHAGLFPGGGSETAGPGKRIAGSLFGRMENCQRELRARLQL